MKNILLLSFAASSAVAFSDTITVPTVQSPSSIEFPADFNYQWSFSGHQYALASKPVYYFDTNKRFSLDAMLGFEVSDNKAFSGGPALAWNFVGEDGFYGKIVGGVLFVTQNKPDLTVGLSFGWKF